jgi:uncharacterized protein (TIGR03000 family)
VEFIMMLNPLRPAILAALFIGPLLVSAARGQESAPPDKALLIVRLPNAANLVIGSSGTSQTGPERAFVSPRLTAGKKYVYDLTATWTENGKSRTEKRTAPVAAGIRTLVDFSEPGKEPEKGPVAEDAKTRTFLFTYSATITDLPAGKKVRIWLPVPLSNDDQKVEIVSKDLPAEGKIGKESKYDNKMLYVEGKAGPDGTLPLKVVYRVTRREVRGAEKEKPDATEVAMYLKPDALVPIDGKPLDLIKGKDIPKDQTDAAHILYDVVNNHMKYSKEGTGWGRGDSVWACDSKYGNCTDFHSVFISLARSQKIPAKFEIGFPLPEKRGEGEIPGYHCWAFFRPEGKGWTPVDISEANKNPKMKDYYFGNLTENRVSFTTGRDITLVPKQDGEPLNFFVYPYVEVDGKAYPAEKIKKKFGYEDVK